MLFCKNCTRLLKEDVPVCPYCGAADDYAAQQNAPPPVPEPGIMPNPDTLDDTINKINMMIDENTQNQTAAPPPVTLDKPGPQLTLEKAPPNPGLTGDAYSGSFNDSYQEPQNSYGTNNNYGAPGGGYNAPNQAACPPPPHAAYAAEEPDVPQAYRVGLILLAIFQPICGIIFGAIFMNKENEKDRKHGKVLLIIGISLLALSLVCCCVYGRFISSAVNDAGDIFDILY